MINYQFTTAAIGFLIAMLIFHLVRRDHMHGPYAVWWLVIAFFAVLLGAFPHVVDNIATHLGVNYPPILSIVIAIAIILIKMLTMDIERSKQERKLRRLTQHLAILEASIEYQHNEDKQAEKDQV